VLCIRINGTAEEIAKINQKRSNSLFKYYESLEAHKKQSEACKGEKNGFYGKRHTKETKKLISEKNKGHNRKHTEETKRKISEALTGRKLSPEHIKKISKNNKGREVTIETREKISKSLAGRKLTIAQRLVYKIAQNRPDVKENNRQRQLKRYEDPAEHEKTSIAVKEVYKNPEIRQKLRDVMNQPEMKQRISEFHTGKKHKEETKLRMSISQQKMRKENPVKEETKRKISESRKGKNYGLVGENHPMFGKHHTEEAGKKMSFSRTDWDFYNEFGTKRSQYPYPKQWTKDLKLKIAERDKHTCQVCKSTWPKQYATHHIDYDKDNCSESNLIFLCASCHYKTYHNKEKWIKHFVNYQKERFGGKNV